MLEKLLPKNESLNGAKIEKEKQKKNSFRKESEKINCTLNFGKYFRDISKTRKKRKRII